MKEKIESEKGKDAFPVAGQKLIYAGNVFYVKIVFIVVSALDKLTMHQVNDKKLV